MSNREGHEQEIETKTREKLKNLPDYLNQFYYRMTANGMQATTKRSYIGYCVNFLKYFSPDLSIDPNNITDSDIDKYMDSITYINEAFCFKNILWFYERKGNYRKRSNQKY